MQPVQMAQQRADDRDRAFAFLKHAREGAIERRGIALGGSQHRVVERQRGAVADDDLRIGEFDAAARAGVERQLLQFGAGQQAVAAQMLDEKRDGIAADRDAMRRKGVADDRGEIARVVGVATDRGGMRRLLEGAAQRRAARQFAGLGDDQRVARHVGEKAGEKRRLLIAGIAQADDAAARHQADLRRLVGEARRIGGECRGGQLGDAERVAQIGADRARQRVGALPHEPGIGAEQQHGANLRVGPAQKPVDLPRGYFHALRLASNMRVISSGSARCVRRDAPPII